MTALSLKRVIAEALAQIGADATFLRLPRGKVRDTIWLAIEHGFGIRQYVSGRHVYIVQTRMAGRLRTVTIGPASVLTMHQAQMVARQVIAYAQVGRDPATERQRSRAAPRFDDYLDEYWQRWGAHWKSKTHDVSSGYRRLYLDDAFPGMFIDAIAEPEVTHWFAEVNDRTSPGAANMVLSLLSGMFNRAEEWGYRLENTNPCRAVRPNRRKPCERFLGNDELARLGGILARERDHIDRSYAAVATAISLLLLTGCRRSEILNLQWGDVRGNRLKLRDSKTGPKTVWLGADARALIHALPRRRDNQWLFWNERCRKPFANINHYWDAIRAEADLDNVRLHDLRHTFASHAAMAGETLPMIGRLLGHATPKSTARYAHLDDDHLLDAAQQIGNAIERMMQG